MLSNLGTRFNLLNRLASNASIKRHTIQKSQIFELNRIISGRVSSVYFSTSVGPQKEKATKEDNRRSLFLHRMQKKINHDDFEGALGVYRKLRSLRLDDHIGVFNKLFNLAIAQDDPTKIEQVMSEMQSANVQPISKTLEILLPYLIAKDMRDRVDTLVDQMKKHNVIIREAGIQESLEEYLKRPRTEKELPKKEKATKKEKDTKEETPKKSSKTTFITNEKQLKKEIEKYMQDNDTGAIKKSNKTSEKRDKKSKKFDEEREEKYEKKITKKEDSIKIKEKSTEIDNKEGKKTKKVTKEKFEATVIDKKPKKHEEDKKSNKKREIIEEDEFDEDEMDDDEVIETTTEKKKKIKKVSKTGVKKVKKSVKKVKKVTSSK
jgi:hypothetical protein